MRSVYSWSVFAIGLVLLACEPPGSRRRQPDTADSQNWNPPARTDQEIRGGCYAEMKAKLAKRQERYQRADRELQAAQERLRVVQTLGEPATVLQAMKDRDAAAADVADADPAKVDGKKLYDDCKRRASLERDRIQAGAIRAERERRDREEQAEADAASERRRAALRAIGEGLQRMGDSMRQPSPAPSMPTYAAPATQPVHQCTQCIQQWCQVQCSGIGNTCAPCIKQWCDFQC